MTRKERWEFDMLKERVGLLTDRVDTAQKNIIFLQKIIMLLQNPIDSNTDKDKIAMLKEQLNSYYGAHHEATELMPENDWVSLESTLSEMPAKGYKEFYKELDKVSDEHAGLIILGNEDITEAATRNPIFTAINAVSSGKKCTFIKYWRVADGKKRHDAITHLNDFCQKHKQYDYHIGRTPEKDKELRCLDALDEKVDEFESKTRASTTTTTNKSRADKNDTDDVVKIVKRICDRQFGCADCPLRSSKIGGVTCLKVYVTNAFNAAAQADFIN